MSQRKCHVVCVGGLAGCLHSSEDKQDTGVPQQKCHVSCMGGVCLTGGVSTRGVLVEAEIMGIALVS